MTLGQIVHAQVGGLDGLAQGGLDARWAAAHDPDHVAAVVTVATPHRGSPVADVALDILPGNSSDALNALADLFGLSTSGSTTIRNPSVLWFQPRRPGETVAVADVPLRLQGIPGCEVCAGDSPETIAAALDRTLRRDERSGGRGREAARQLDERILTGRVVDIYRSVLAGTKGHHTAELAHV